MVLIAVRLEKETEIFSFPNRNAARQFTRFLDEKDIPWAISQSIDTTVRQGTKAKFELVPAEGKKRANN